MGHRASRLRKFQKRRTVSFEPKADGASLQPHVSSRQQEGASRQTPSPALSHALMRSWLIENGFYARDRSVEPELKRIWSDRHHYLAGDSLNWAGMVPRPARFGLGEIVANIVSRSWFCPAQKLAGRRAERCCPRRCFQGHDESHGNAVARRAFDQFGLSLSRRQYRRFAWDAVHADD